LINPEPVPAAIFTYMPIAINFNYRRMSMRLLRIATIFLCIAFVAGTSYSQQNGMFGVRGGIGTDIGGGIAYGGTLLYMFSPNASPVEVGLTIFGGSFEETTEEFHTYEETTDIMVVAVTANWLFSYKLNAPGLFFTAGAGVGAISVDWEERSDGDSSLGTPLAGGGSKQSEDGTSAGFIASIGIGQNFGGGMDIRFEIPVFFMPGAPGSASTIAPTFTLMLGLHF
jgi:hypothetical protein